MHEISCLWGQYGFRQTDCPVGGEANQKVVIVYMARAPSGTTTWGKHKALSVLYVSKAGSLCMGGSGTERCVSPDTPDSLGNRVILMTELVH